MELRLQRLIKTFENISVIHNLDFRNPIRFVTKYPDTSDNHLIIASVDEPTDYTNLPLNTIWFVFNTENHLFRRALKLKGFTVDYPGSLPGFNSKWVLIHTYDELYSDEQYFSGDKGATGDKGPVGNKGPSGDKGPDGDYDEAAIIAEALARVRAALNNIIPVSITISGQTTVNSGSSTDYSATVNLSDSTSDIDPTGLTWTVSSSSLGTINASGLFTAANATNPVSGSINVSYTRNNVTVTASYNITVSAKSAISIAVTGSTTVDEGSSNTYTARVTYSDTSVEIVTPTWSIVESGLGNINTNGVFTANQVASNSTATIRASFTDANNAIVTGNLPVTIRNLVPQSMVITGSTTVPESTTAQYTATVTLNNGSPITVVPIWSVSNITIGSIDSSGLLTAPSVNANVTGNITASYTASGVTVTATLPITITNVAAQIYPYYGVANMNNPKNEAFILALPNRGPNPNRTISGMALDTGSAGSGLKGYYAYPASYGEAEFIDESNGFKGGWDGARNDPRDLPGPVTISVNVNGTPTDFLLYGHDFDGLGDSSWTVV